MSNPFLCFCIHCMHNLAVAVAVAVVAVAVQLLLHDNLLLLDLLLLVW